MRHSARRKWRSTFLGIVASTIVSAAHCATPDVIYFNGRIITVDRQSSVREAFAVTGDRFSAVGGNQAVQALAGRHTRRVDLKGATVIPGLNDGHDHLWNTARYLYRGVDLVGVTTLEEIQHRLSAAAQAAQDGRVIFSTLGWSVHPSPTRKDLDRVSTEVPVVLIGSRRGIAVLNTAALRRLDVTRGHPVFGGVKVPVDEGGDPTGATPGYPTSVLMLEALLPPPSDEERSAILHKAMAERNALGITGIRELAVWPDAVAEYRRLRAQGRLTLRLALGVEFPDQADTAARLAAMPRPRRDDPWLLVDTVGEEPWSPGTMALAPYTQLLLEIERLGWRTAPHVNADPQRGVLADDATEATLAAYEAVDRSRPLRGKRWYIEHVPFATPAQMERMAKLGLIVSLQDAGFAGEGATVMPPERLAQQNPVRGFLEHQLVVIGGSDYAGPRATDATPNDLLRTLAFYATRKNREGALTAPSEKISREQALRLFTANAAYAMFQEKRRGQIVPGMQADFVVLNQDLLTVADDELAATRPLATFVGGTQVYAAPGADYR